MTTKQRIDQLVKSLPEDAVLDVLENLERQHQPGKKPRSGLLALDAALKEMGEKAPQEEREKIPSDFSEQLDHYIYGTPKR